MRAKKSKPPQFLSTNFLDLSSVCKPTGDYTDFKDPASLRDSIHFQDISNNLFPVLKTGISKWQYLFIARDCLKKKWRMKPRAKQKTIEQNLRKISKRLKIRRVPQKYASLSPYLSMCKELLNWDKPVKEYSNIYSKSEYKKNLKTFASFIDDKRRKFDGKRFYLYRGWQKEWRKCFKKAFGEPGRQYCKMLDEKNANSEFKFNNSEDTITFILENPKKYKSLTKGAYAYALFRCLYGLKDSSDSRSQRVLPQHGKWVKLLKSHSKYLSGAKPYINSLNEKSPRYAAYAKQISDKEDRQVLSSLKFYTFFKLYRNDWLAKKYE